MDSPFQGSGFSGYSGYKAPSPEAIEYATKALEQAGYAERCRLQNIEAARLEAEKEKLACRVLGLILAVILAIPIVLTITVYLVKELLR